MTSPRTVRVSPLLGTDVAVRIDGADDDVAEHAARSAIAEMERLEAVLSRFRPDSALERWKRDDLDEVPDEFAELMRVVAHWHARTKGLLSPRAAQLRLEANDTGETEAVVGLGYEIDETGLPVRTADCTHLDLHAIGKGWIVDRAVETARAVLTSTAPEGNVLVAAGGDLGRAGPGSTSIRIDDPTRPYDNAPPVDHVTLDHGGLATSGSARRRSVGAEVDESHLVDPRSGRPADQSASVSVLADRAEDADAWATAWSLLTTEEAVEAANSVGVGVLVIGQDRAQRANDRWCAARIRTAR